MDISLRHEIETGQNLGKEVSANGKSTDHIKTRKCMQISQNNSFYENKATNLNKFIIKTWTRIVLY